jgi:hypothetical protein
VKAGRRAADDGDEQERNGGPANTGPEPSMNFVTACIFRSDIT